MVDYNLQIKRATSRAGFTQRRDDATRTLPLALLLFLTQKRCVVAASREVKNLVMWRGRSHKQQEPIKPDRLLSQTTPIAAFSSNSARGEGE
jgi:hypothetical protein